MTLKAIIDHAAALLEHNHTEKALWWIQRAQLMLTDTLPGVEVASHQTRFKKPSLDEVKLYCAKSGICDRDAEWFWNHMEGRGWKNAGKPVASWERTMIAWRLAGHLPSQKQKPMVSAVPATSRERVLLEMKRLGERIQNGR